MTPEETAKSIYDKMKGFRVKNSHRKKCAIVAVDEILDVLHSPEVATLSLGYEETLDLWLKVRQELELL